MEEQWKMPEETYLSSNFLDAFYNSLYIILHL